MRKLFLLSLALLASFNLWAADPDYSSYDWTEDQATAVVGTHGSVVIGGALGEKGNVSGHWYLPIGANLKNSDNPWTGYMSIASTAGAIDSIKILYCPNGTKATSVAWATWGSDVTPTQRTLDHGVTAGTTSSKAWESAIWEKIDLTANSSYTVYLSRSIREFQDKDGNSISNFGGGQTINVLGIQVWLHPSCVTTINTQPTGATIALGDANPELSIVATNAASYAWKESSDGTSYDGVSTLGTSPSYTPSVNDAVQTKYYYCEVTSDCDGTTIVKSDIVTVNVVGAISYYTVTLVPAGGTIVDATGWTLNAGNYEKEVAEGSSVTLPTFTKDDRTFKTWRNNADIDIELPITITKDTTLTAVWTKTIVKTIYSWEGAEGGASEVGGTVEGSADNLINQVSAGYYCLKIDGNDSYSGNLVTITLSGEEKIKTGDKIKYWGFYNKNKSASARPKMRDANGSNASIFDDPNDLPNLYSGGDPAERTFTVPASINTNAVQLTRSQTGSNTWISKLQIIREEQVEEANIATVTFDSNGGSSVASLEVVKGEAALKPADPTKDGCLFAGWYLNEVEYNWSSTVSGDITLVAHWSQSFTVSYYDGETLLGTEDVEANGNPTEYADYQTKAHYTFDAWKNNAAVNINAATLVVTKDTALYGYWTENPKAVVTFQVDGVQYGTIQNVYVGEKVASVDSPTKAGNVFKGWYNGESKFDFTTALASDAAITLDAKWEAVDPNHYVLAYNDDFHFDGATYKTPEGKVAANTGDNKNMTTPYTLFSGNAGITSVVMTSGTYDSKSGDIQALTAFIKVGTSAKLTTTIAEGYIATLKIKAGGYSGTRTITISNATPASGTTTGKVVNDNKMNVGSLELLTFELTAGEHDLTVDGNLYIAELDITAEVDPSTALDNTDVNAKAVKRLENGILVIEKNGVRYNVTGQVIK